MMNSKRLQVINSRRLQAFGVFGELLNFTRAAKRLHISQPSLHAQIKKLEGELSVELYEKRGRELRLTSAGERVLAHARDCRDRDGRFRAELAGEPSETPLVLAAGEGALLYLLGHSLKVLGEAHGRRLQVLTRDAAQTIAAVKRGEATVGVTVTSSNHEGLASARLKLIGLMAVMPKSHPLAKRSSVTFPALSRTPIVSAPRGYPHRLTLEQQFATNSADLDVAVEATGWESMVHLASLGLGVALVNDFCRVPKGCVGLPVKGGPKVEYRLLRRAGQMSEEARLMTEAILGFV